MSNFSESDVQRAAEIRDLLIKQISDKKEELDRLGDMLNLIDTILKRSSFKPASTISRRSNDNNDQFQKDSSIRIEMNQEEQRNDQLSTRRVTADHVNPNVDISPEYIESETKELRRTNDSLLLGNAEISPQNIKITPAENLLININTPPFRSFFLNRILDGMKSKDGEKNRRGEIMEYEILNYQVNNDAQGVIKSITITNYRDKERLQDILSTVTWVLSKMVEKGSPQKDG
ncbi:MAG TPA: hypothetical protein VH415_15720 [Nitrososphaeraceae archaeon]|jgi:hypothetical protein